MLRKQRSSLEESREILSLTNILFKPRYFRRRYSNIMQLDLLIPLFLNLMILFFYSKNNNLRLEVFLFLKVISSSFSCNDNNNNNKTTWPKFESTSIGKVLRSRQSVMRWKIYFLAAFQTDFGIYNVYDAVVDKNMELCIIEIMKRKPNLITRQVFFFE